LVIFHSIQGSSSLGVWRDLARSIFTGQDVPQHEVQQGASHISSHGSNGNIMGI
jgi:hypothetical protein